MPYRIFYKCNIGVGGLEVGNIVIYIDISMSKHLYIYWPQGVEGSALPPGAPWCLSWVPGFTVVHLTCLFT